MERVNLTDFFKSFSNEVFRSKNEQVSIDITCHTQEDGSEHTYRSLGYIDEENDDEFINSAVGIVITELQDEYQIVVPSNMDAMYTSIPEYLQRHYVKIMQAANSYFSSFNEKCACGLEMSRNNHNAAPSLIIVAKNVSYEFYEVVGEENESSVN